MKLSFVISTQPTTFQAVAFDPTFEANIARLAELGYDGVELAVREPAKLDVVAVKRTLDKHHLQVPAIGTGQAYVEEHLSFTDPDASIRAQALARIQSHIDLAREFGALVIIGLIRGKVQPNVSRDQAHAWLVESMKQITQVANDQGVRVVVEPVNRYETDLINNVPDALELIEEIGAKNLGVLFDTFHANIEEPRIEVGLLVCRSHLFHVHIADSNRWYPGAGHTDFGRVLATLRAMKYDGWISAEILPKPEMFRAAEQTIRTMQAIAKV
jgi:sugar phosphate isomerase/epimerase